MKRLIYFFLFLNFSSFLVAQSDTITVMTYNLLYYRETTSFCTNSNNNPTTKDNAMKDIIDYVLPDILVVNEMGGGNSINPGRLQINALNKNGRSYYKAAARTGSGQSLINMLYYNEDKFVLESQTNVSKDLSNRNIVRVIDIYTLRYLDTNLAMHKDTTRINVIAAHLKAGSSSANETERGEATEAVMAYLDSNNLDGNFLFAGDLNLYKSTEPAYQDLLNYTDTNYRFYDPVNQSGNWSNRSIYASLHTQSTRTSGGCFAGGGMDDRFDFILASQEIIKNEENVEYISGTYKALGQDGKRFNQTIKSPINTSEDSVVIEALNKLSDHLPVVMDLKITLPTVVSVQETPKKIPRLIFENPNSGLLRIDFHNQTIPVQKLEILNLAGQLVKTIVVSNRRILEENINYLPRGTYFIRVTYKSFQQSLEKLIKI